jgi:hypothetical protein
MGKISLKTIKELLMLLKKKSLKEIFLGNKVKYNSKEQKWLELVKTNDVKFRSGDFIKKDFLHKGKGKVYLFSLGKKSVLLFDEKVKIQPGPDLYVWLSEKETLAKKASIKNFGEILDLGLLKGTKGGQSYTINKNIEELKKYKLVIIHCKKFDALFTYTKLR